MTKRKHPRGVSDRLLTSGLLQVFGPDLLLLVAVALIGVTVFRLSPDLVPSYAGVLLLIAWWALMKSKTPKDPKAS